MTIQGRLLWKFCPKRLEIFMFPRNKTVLSPTNATVINCKLTYTYNIISKITDARLVFIRLISCVRLKLVEDQIKYEVENHKFNKTLIYIYIWWTPESSKYIIQRWWSYLLMSSWFQECKKMSIINYLLKLISQDIYFNFDILTSFIGQQWGNNVVFCRQHYMRY